MNSNAVYKRICAFDYIIWTIRNAGVHLSCSVFSQLKTWNSFGFFTDVQV